MRSFRDNFLYPLVIYGFTGQNSKAAYLEGARKSVQRLNYRSVLHRQGSKSMLEVNFIHTSKGSPADYVAQATIVTRSSKYLIGLPPGRTMTKRVSRTKVMNPEKNRTMFRLDS